jgi:galacturan 1,4-alpha-galacturonidase
MWCNGSHGISVGSLGQYYGETDIVSDIYVRNITMMNAQNGARIKVFGGSNDTNSVSGGGSGYVRNVTFQDFRNESESSASTLVPTTNQSVDVDNPIYLTQCYSSSAQQ